MRKRPTFTEWYWMWRRAHGGEDCKDARDAKDEEGSTDEHEQVGSYGCGGDVSNERVGGMDCRGGCGGNA